MEDMIEVQPMEVRGTKFRVYVDRDGKFSATGPDGEDQRLSRDTRKSLLQGLTAATRKTVVKLSVPFLLWTEETGRQRHGTITGVHASNGNKLVTWADGGHDQIRSGFGWSTTVLGDLSTEQIQELRKKWAAYDAAKRAYIGLISEHRIDLDDAVKKAIQEASDDGD
jgi:hypothetical protein